MIPAQYDNLTIGLQPKNIKTHFDHEDNGTSLTVADGEPIDDAQPE